MITTVQHPEYCGGTSLKVLIILMLVLGFGSRLACADEEKSSDLPKPNVLFLAVDDMRDWVGCLNGYAGDVLTPNIDRLANSGTLFANAHCASPVCNPSRTAVMLGRMPSSTGIYNNGQWWKPNLPDAVSLPELFRQHGYAVAGAGKIFHHTAGNNPPEQWDTFQRLTFRDDPWYRGNRLNYPWSTHLAYPEGFPFSGVPDLPHENDWGSLPHKEEAVYDDALTVDFACAYLKQNHDKPFFLACGIFRPHLPWYAPKKYFDLYPLESVRLPPVDENDLLDIPAEGRKLSESRRADFEKIKLHSKWRHAIRAYLASISFADAQLGRVLDALQASSHDENTIVVLWSDHGWHLGEKQHWHKMTLWEEATRVPLVIQVPGDHGGAKCHQPVSLVDLFPTLVELCDLEEPSNLDGTSLVPQLNDPDAIRTRPAVIEYQRGQCAVRSAQFRYIVYSDGSEELYDHRSDPNEWKNLANDDHYADSKTALTNWITREWVAPAKRKNAFRFDAESYTWKLK